MTTVLDLKTTPVTVGDHVTIESANSRHEGYVASILRNEGSLGDKITRITLKGMPTFSFDFRGGQWEITAHAPIAELPTKPGSAVMWDGTSCAILIDGGLWNASDGDLYTTEQLGALIGSATLVPLIPCSDIDKVAAATVRSFSGKFFNCLRGFEETGSSRDHAFLGRDIDYAATETAKEFGVDLK